METLTEILKEAAEFVLKTCWFLCKLTLALLLFGLYKIDN